MKKTSKPRIGRPPSTDKLANGVRVMFTDADYAWVAQEARKESRKLSDWCRLLILAEKKRRESGEPPKAE